MPEIQIERSHGLGMAKARKLAAQWAERVEKAYGVRCVHTQGRGEDLIEFSRAGVHGAVKVSGKRFELGMKLGFLFGLFSQRISEGVARELDDLLGAAEAQAPKKAPTVPPRARRTAAATAKKA